MVKTYYKYELKQNVGQVTGTQCNFAYHHQTKRFFCGTNQYVVVVNARTGETVESLSRQHKNSLVRYVAVFEDRVYAGFEDGDIIAWDCRTLEFIVSLDQHKSAVTSMCCSQDHTLLVSAGQDCRIIVWDLLSEESSTIKQAHKSPITQIELVRVLNSTTFLNEQLIVSAGKDGFIKVWGLKNLQLLDVLSSLTNEVCCFAYNAPLNLLYVGTNREDLVIVKIEPYRQETTRVTRYLQAVGRFKRNNFARPLQMILESSKLQLLNSDKILETYALLDERDFIKRKKRLAKRRKGKEEVGNTAIEQDQEKPIEQDINLQEEARLKFEKSKVLLQKAYNFLVVNSKVLINNGRDLYDITIDSQLTTSLGITHNLSLVHPYIVQRNYSTCKVLSVTNMTQLYTMDLSEQQEPVIINDCQIYKGYLVAIAQQCLIVWSLAKGEELLRDRNIKGKGLSVSDSGLLVWKEAVLQFCKLGLDKNKNFAANKLEEKFYPENIVQCSHLNDQKYIVCTQDAHINIYFSDTHRQYLKMYGHKLPITAYDTSSDGNLLLTGSVDKDIKLWGLDFGNCIKSIFAHSEAVTAVRFVPLTHYFFTGSKDGHIKYWDGDTHQLILDLEESMGEVREICASRAGDYMIAGGIDGGFRVWRQTTEQIYFNEQQQKRVEKMMIEEYANKKLQENVEKTTYADLKNGEEIIQCLEAADTPDTLLKLLKKISPSKLKSSLSFLHRHHVDRLSVYLQFCLDRRVDLQLVWRVCEALDVRDLDIGQKLRDAWQEDRDTIRTNIEALRLIGKVLNDNKQMGMI